MRQNEYEAAVAAFVRSRGITRCPTACAFPTQGTVTAADRAALEDYAAARERLRQRRNAVRMQWFGHLGSRYQQPNSCLREQRWLECRP
jgi:hypothetical protein